MFPDFDENLRQAFRSETELFLDSQLREDRSVAGAPDGELHVPQRTARAPLRIPRSTAASSAASRSPTSRRGGLLGQGSILTVTSYPDRTSPVLRGEMGAREHPRHAAASSAGRRAAVHRRLARTGSRAVRERLEQHRRNPVCASCHAPMDPLGFALENFDAIGGGGRSKRTRRSTRPAYCRRHRFNGPAELRRVLVIAREQFVATVAEKLLTYALGRGVEVLRCARRAPDPAGRGRRRLRWSSLVLGDRQERAVSDEEAASHDRHQKCDSAPNGAAAAWAPRWRCRCSTP